MPLPLSKNPGETISFLKHEKPNMPAKQRLAIALSQARKAGAPIPKPPKK